MDADDRHPQPVARADGIQGFDDAGRMKPGPLYDRVLDVCEKLMEFTLLTRERAAYLVDRYSERKEREPERLRVLAADIRFVPQ